MKYVGCATAFVLTLMGYYALKQCREKAEFNNLMKGHCIDKLSYISEMMPITKFITIDPASLFGKELIEAAFT